MAAIPFSRGPMRTQSWTTKNVACGVHSQDRVAIHVHDGITLVVLADGAGGMAGGGEAAQAVLDARSAWSLRQALESSGTACVHWLQAIDRMLATSPAGGQCTAIVAVIDGVRIVGASVGDSEAWLVESGSVRDLTEHQHRKPLVGSGRATAIPFAAACVGARLLVASDGLFKYTTRERIVDAVHLSDLNDAIRTLVESVRLRSGALQDDISIALIET